MSCLFWTAAFSITFSSPINFLQLLLLIQLILMSICAGKQFFCFYTDYMNGLFSHDRHDYGIKRRLSPQVSALQENSESACSLTQESSHHPHLDRHISWRRISLLIFAITIHNIPGLLCCCCDILILCF